jgi:hypothetical protein
MDHWSKAKLEIFYINNFINISMGIKSIKFICTCRSQVEKKKPSLDKSYTITSKKIFWQLWFEEVLYSSLMHNWLKAKATEWKFFKVYHIEGKRLNPFCNYFLPYILISIKNNESKVIKYFKRTIFYTITIIDYIIIIHKCVFTWLKRTR